MQLRSAERDEAPAIAALVRASEAVDGVPRVLSDDELVSDFAASHMDLALDTRVVEVDGELVAWSCVWNPPAQHRLDRAELYGDVLPAHRGQGIGRALMEWSLARASERFASRGHGLPCFVRTSAYDWLDDRERLYRRAGFDAVRWHEDLLRPLDEVPAVVPVAGVSLHPWPSGDDERLEELRQVRNAAFADHWGSTVIEPDSWRGFVASHAARPDLSVYAVDDATGAALGVCINQSYPEDEAVTGRRDGWIANIGTVREARGRGVASAMITWSLDAFARAGFSHAALDVDSDNPTGAAQLYRNLGFEPHLRSVTYEIQVAGGPDETTE